MKRYILYAVFCIALLPVLLLRDFTPDNELRYLSIADEAIRNNTFLTFTNHGIPYADKPPFYLWIVMLGKWLFGSHQMWFLALASLIPSLVVVDVLDRWCGSKLDERSRLSARLMLLTSALFAGMAVTLRMDMLMCMFIVLALRSFYRLYRSRQDGRAPDGRTKAERWLFPVYVFLAVFSKGPIGILVPLLSSVVFLVYKKDIRQFGHYWGVRTWGVLVLLCAAWFGLAYAEGGQAYLDNMLFHQTFDRAVNAFTHDRPFYFYGMSIWYSIAPWSLLALGTIIVAAFRRHHWSELEQYFATIIVTTFVMLSCISSKIHIYLLPAFPFIIYTAAMMMSEYEKSKWLRLSIAIPAAILVLALPAFVIAVHMGGTGWLGLPLLYLASGILSASGVLALIVVHGRRKDIHKAIAVMAGGILLAVFTGGWSLRALRAYIGYGALCEQARKTAATLGTSDFRTWQISRAENMDVYLGHDVVVVPKDSIPGTVSGHASILMTKKKYADKFAGHKTYEVGPYAVIVLAK